MASFDGYEAETSDWELSKENVLPLRQGRNFQKLLQSQSGDETAKRLIKEQQHAFEAELRVYTGDDPLEVWDRYIKWTEQNFSKGGQENNMSMILERCAMQFKEEVKYANDPRYLSVWLRFIRFCADSLDIFNFLYSNGIGVELAAFYEAWAVHFESVGNTKKADFIFTQGIERGARPISVLQVKQREFQARVARHLTVGMEHETSGGGGIIPDATEEQRTTLGDLRGVGKRQRAPHMRVGDAKLTTRGGLKSNRKSIDSGNSIQSFSVHTDAENNTPVLPASGVKEWGAVPSGKTLSKENDRSASRWGGKSKVGRKHVPHMFMDEVPKMAIPSFQVHEDESDLQVSATPRKVSAVECVLSARKADKPSDPFLNIQGSQQKPAASGASVLQGVPMYCKFQVYSGAQEFSFEEIRAVRFENKQRNMAEVERAKKEAEAFKANCQRQMQEQMTSHQQQIQELQNQMLQLKTRVRSPVQSDFTGDTTNSVDHPMKSLGTSSGSLPTPDPSFSLQPGQGSVESQKSNLNSTSQTSVSGNNSSSLLSGPSPTVNTMMAYNQVRGWYGNTSIQSEFAAPLLNILNAENPAATPISNTASSTPAFAVFEDDAPPLDKENNFCMRPQSNSKPALMNVLKQREEAQEPAKAVVPFIVYEDEPLPCKASSVKRQAFSALRPRLGSEDDAMQQEVCSGGPTFASSQHDFDNDDPDDMTFAPKFSSTCNFTAMSHMTATPFTPAVNQAEDTTAAPVVYMDSTASNVTTHSQDSSNSKQDSDSVCMGRSKKDGRRISCLLIQENNQKLSPINEDSEGSSLGSSNGCSTMAALTFGHTTIDASTNVSVAPKVSVAPVAMEKDFNRTFHEIDTTGYVVPDEAAAQDQLNASIAIDTHDPFDEKLIGRFLSRLSPPIELHANYHAVPSAMPRFASNQTVTLGGVDYLLTHQVGQGGYASVYACAPCMENNFDNEEDSMDLDGQEVVIKVQKPACVWEFYISTELIKRCTQLPPPLNLGDVIMGIQEGFFFSDGSCLLNQRHVYGTLLDLTNACAKHSLQLPFDFFAYLGCEMLLMMEMLQQCDIIHGDIKPDNFLIMRFPRLTSGQSLHHLLDGKQKMLKLIDFGRSIDMRQFPNGTTFSASVNTSGFQCIEMKTNRPWTYQTDLFGVVGTLYVLLFGKYMDITFGKEALWKPTGYFRRFWSGVETWKELFVDFLNIPSSDALPDLRHHRLQLEKVVRLCKMKAAQFNSLMEDLEKALIRI